MRYLLLCCVLVAGCAVATADAKKPDNKPDGERPFQVAAVEAPTPKLCQCPNCQCTDCQCVDGVCKCPNCGPLEARSKRVLYFTLNEGCAPCRAFSNNGAFDAMKATGWCIGTAVSDHVQIVDIRENPELADKFGVGLVPLLMLIEDDREVRRMVPSARTDGWAIKELWDGFASRPVSRRTVQYQRYYRSSGCTTCR